MAPLGLLLVQADTADILGIAERTSLSIAVPVSLCAVALITDALSTANADEVSLLNRSQASMTAKGIIVGVDDALERGGCRSSGILHGRQPAVENFTTVSNC